MRGIAAFCVVVYHARQIFWTGLGDLWRKHGAAINVETILGYGTAPFSLGYLGVTLFFVVSGFSIHFRPAHQLATDSSRASLSIKEFFLRRFLRLYPTYCVALVLTALLDFFSRGYLPDLTSHEDFTASAFWSTLFGLQGFVSHHYGSASVFWTMVLEMHLYLAYPLLFHLSKRRGPEFVFLFTLAISFATIVALAIFHIPEKWPYWHGGGPVFLKYWFVWSAGFYAAEVASGRAKHPGWLSAPIGFSALCLGMALTSLKMVDLAEIPFGLAFGSLLLICFRQSPLVKNSYLIRGAASVGLVSYSLYCIHKPVIRLFRVLVNSGERSSSLLLVACSVAATLASAVILYWMVEHWSIALSHGVRRKAHPVA